MDGCLMSSEVCELIGVLCCACCSGMMVWVQCRSCRVVCGGVCFLELLDWELGADVMS